MPKLMACLRKAMLSAPGVIVMSTSGLAARIFGRCAENSGLPSGYGVEPSRTPPLPFQHLAQHGVVLLPPRIVGVEDPPLLAEVLGHPGADRAAGDGRVERLVERERAPVRPGGDLVGLAHRDEELPGLLGLLVDRHLYVRGQAAHDELALLVLDELLRPLGADGGLELVVAEQDLDLLPQDAARGVDFLHRHDRALLLVLGEGAEGTSRRPGEADLDRVAALRLEDGRKGRDGGAGRGRGEKCTSVHRAPPWSEWRRS